MRGWQELTLLKTFERISPEYSRPRHPERSQLGDITREDDERPVPVRVGAVAGEAMTREEPVIPLRHRVRPNPDSASATNDCDVHESLDELVAPLVIPVSRHDELGEVVVTILGAELAESSKDSAASAKDDSHLEDRSASLRLIFRDHDVSVVLSDEGADVVGRGPFGVILPPGGGTEDGLVHRGEAIQIRTEERGR